VETVLSVITSSCLKNSAQSKFRNQLKHFYTRYHGVELGQVSCGKQTFGCGI